MSKTALIAFGIIAAGGIGLYAIAKASGAIAPIATAAKPTSTAAQTTLTTSAITAGSSLAGDFFNWLSQPGSNTGSANSTITTPAATTAAANGNSFGSSLDQLAQLDF